MDDPECSPPNEHRLDSESWPDAVLEDERALADFVVDAGPMSCQFQTMDDRFRDDLDDVDMEDPSVPPWVLSQWVLRKPLEGPIGTEPILLNPGLLVSPPLAALIAARRRGIPPGRPILRAPGTRSSARPKRRVQWCTPVVSDEQDPPGHEPTAAARALSPQHIRAATPVAWASVGRGSGNATKGTGLEDEDGAEPRGGTSSWWKSGDAWASSWGSSCSSDRGHLSNGHTSSPPSTWTLTPEWTLEARLGDVEDCEWSQGREAQRCRQQSTRANDWWQSRTSSTWKTAPPLWSEPWGVSASWRGRCHGWQGAFETSPPPERPWNGAEGAIDEVCAPPASAIATSWRWDQHSKPDARIPPAGGDSSLCSRGYSSCGFGSTTGSSPELSRWQAGCWQDSSPLRGGRGTGRTESAWRLREQDDPSMECSAYDRCEELQTERGRCEAETKMQAGSTGRSGEWAPSAWSWGASRRGDAADGGNATGSSWESASLPLARRPDLQSKGGASPDDGSAPRPVPARWRHPAGLAITQLMTGTRVNGQVTNITKAGVFVNFGAQKDGLLSSNTLRNSERNVPQIGDWVYNLIIGKVDLQKNRVSLQLLESMPLQAARGGGQLRGESSDLSYTSGSCSGSSWENESQSRGLKPESSISSLAGSRGGGGRGSGGESTAELDVCGPIEGRVTGVTTQGVNIEYGARKCGWLPDNALHISGQTFHVGEKVSDLLIDTVDKERNRVTLRFSRSRDIVDPSAPLRAADYDRASSRAESQWEGGGGGLGTSTAGPEGGTGSTLNRKD